MAARTRAQATRAARKASRARQRVFELTGSLETAVALNRISKDVVRVAVETANVGRKEFLDLVYARALMSRDTGALIKSLGVIDIPVRGVIGRAIRTTISNYQLITAGGLETEIGTVAIGGKRAPYVWYAHAYAAERGERFWWGSRGGGSSPLRDMRHIYGERIYDAVDNVYHWGAY